MATTYKKSIFKPLCVFAWSSLLLGNTLGCTNNPSGSNGSQTKTIGSDYITPVQNQGNFGDCWSFSLHAMLETMYKVKTGNTITLSANALALQRLLINLQTVTQSAIAQKISQNNIQSFIAPYLTQGAEGFKMIGSTGGALLLVTNTGVLPTSVWDVSIPDQATYDKLYAGITNRYIQNWQTTNQGQSYVLGTQLDENGNQVPYVDTGAILTDMSQKVLVGDVFPSAPPFGTQPIMVDGDTYTSSQDLLTNGIGFNQSNFVDVWLNTEQDLETVVGWIKAALGQQYMVPIGIDIDTSRVDYKDSVFLAGSGPFKPVGGHNIAIADFVNTGGTLETVDPSTLAVEIAKPFSALDYLWIKNSWGSADPITGQADPFNGMWELKAGYLQAQVALSTSDGGKESIDVLLPRSVIVPSLLEDCNTQDAKNDNNANSNTPLDISMCAYGL